MTDPTTKTLVIGDIHGCYDELRDLLNKVPLTRDDHIVHIGDMVDRGPYPAEVVDFFRDTPNARSIMGNREDKHIRSHDGDMQTNSTQEITRRQFGDDAHFAEAIAYFRTLPLYLDLPDALLVHGYYEPGVPIQQQDRNVLLGHPEGEDRLQQRGASDWVAHYDGDKPIVFGHRDYPFLHYQRRAWALDTRCVYGGTLTGLLLPAFTVYSVTARADHWQQVQQQYPDLM